MEGWLDSIVENLALFMQDNLWLAPVFCLAAGIVTSFTPCSLSVVPIALKYVKENAHDEKYSVLKISVIITLGMSITFIIFGLIASVIGHYMHEIIHWWSYGIGILLIIMALQMWGILKIEKNKGEHVHHKHDKHLHDGQCTECGALKKIGQGYAGAFLTGTLGGVFASHCAAPMMVALLTMIAKADLGIVSGILLMLLYAIGHGLLLVFSGFGYNKMFNFWERNNHKRIAKIQRVLLGIIVGAIGLLLFFS